MKPILRQTIGLAAALAMLAGPALAQQQGQWQGQEQGQNHGGGPGMGGPSGGEQHPMMAPQHPEYGQPQHSEGGSGGWGQHPMMSAPQHPEYARPEHSEGGPRHHHYGDWQRGDHYDGHRYVVQDWHHRHLDAPPEGYEWVQSGDNYVLIAITTGIVAGIIAGSMAR